MFAIMFSYVSNRVPEISDEIYKIDAAMCAGFGWELGPFEIWDAIGIQKGIDLIKQEELTFPKWLEKIDKNTTFYSISKGEKNYFDFSDENHKKNSNVK